MTFDEVYILVEKSSHETAFNRGECEKLWEIATSIPKDGHALEIGVQFGRSATVIAQAAKMNKFAFYAIDNWQEEYSKEAEKHVIDILLGELQLPIILINEDSKDAWKSLPKNVEFDLVHIDGDHEYPGVLRDCKTYLPFVKVGGYACFDDFGHDSLPGVWQAVTEYMTDHEDCWQYIGRYGDKLGVYRRIKGDEING